MNLEKNSVVFAEMLLPARSITQGKPLCTPQKRILYIIHYYYHFVLIIVRYTDCRVLHIRHGMVSNPGQGVRLTQPHRGWKTHTHTRLLVFLHVFKRYQMKMYLNSERSFVQMLFHDISLYRRWLYTIYYTPELNSFENS